MLTFGYGADGSVSCLGGRVGFRGTDRGDFTGACIVSPACFGEIFSTGRPPPGAVELSDWGAAVFTGKTICLSAGARGENTVCQKETQIVLTVKEPENAALRKRVMEAFLKALCLSVTSSLCGAIQPSMAHLGIPMPEIRVRSMTSRWGSCTPGARPGYLCPAVGGGAADLY